MTLAKFQPNRTTGSKVMAINLKKKGTFRNRVPGPNYPVPGYPDFANYPVLVTRFLTSLFLIALFDHPKLHHQRCAYEKEG